MLHMGKVTSKWHRTSVRVYNTQIRWVGGMGTGEGWTGSRLLIFETPALEEQPGCAGMVESRR